MNLSNIRLLIYDCDGVLTDNRVLVSETGEEYALFHRGDGYAIRMLKELGIRQIIVSTEENPIVEHRARKLKIDVVHSVTDKRTAVVRYCREHGFATEEAMFIGNDLNDFDAMKTVGICGCPRDAEPEIQDICHWISTKNGGQGLVRELYRIIAESREG